MLDSLPSDVAGGRRYTQRFVLEKVRVMAKLHMGMGFAGTRPYRWARLDPVSLEVRFFPERPDGPYVAELPSIPDLSSVHPRRRITHYEDAWINWVAQRLGVPVLPAKYTGFGRERRRRKMALRIAARLAELATGGGISEGGCW